jgi:ABC-type phosphate/phosphonate transport system substrate-binding protein
MLLHVIKNISWKTKLATFSLILNAIIFSILPNTAFAQESLRLVIQPIQSEQRTREIFQPMAEYFQHLTGLKVEIVTYPNFISYWTETQKPDSYEIAFDAAHFIDYRDKNLDYTVLAKQPGNVSISLVVTCFDIRSFLPKLISSLHESFKIKRF